MKNNIVRWIERNGEKVLQETLIAGSDDESHWEDVPTVKEPKKPKEFMIESFPTPQGYFRAWLVDNPMSIIKYHGEKPNQHGAVKTREVLE